jgi:ankyrin repeat protein
MVDIDFCSQPDKRGYTPLWLICEYGRDMDAIRLLALERPQDFFATPEYDESSLCDRLMDRQARFRPGFNEVQVGYAQIIADVIKAWPDGVLHVDKNGRTLLHKAILVSRYDAHDEYTFLRTILAIHRRDDGDGPAVKRLQLLRECGGVQDSDGRTPLHNACQTNCPRDVITILIAIHPNALNFKDKHGMTPLHTFRQHNRRFLTKSNYGKGDPFRECWSNYLADTAMALLTGAPVRCTDLPSLHKLLHNQECTPDIAKLLIHVLRNQASLKDGDGNLPLHIVASRYSAEDIMYGKVIELLLELYPSACQISNSEGSLPLHIVASRDSNDNIVYGKVIEALLEVYPTACQISNSEGTLPLQLMDRSGKSWSNGMRMVLLQHPAAVLDLELNHVARCSLLAKVGSEEKPGALFRLLKDAPVFAPRANVAPQAREME